jgi:hypothetical protein
MIDWKENNNNKLVTIMVTQTKATLKLKKKTQEYIIISKNNYIKILI